MFLDYIPISSTSHFLLGRAKQVLMQLVLALTSEPSHHLVFFVVQLFQLNSVVT